MTERQCVIWGLSGDEQAFAERVIDYGVRAEACGVDLDSDLDVIAQSIAYGFENKDALLVCAMSAEALSAAMLLGFSVHYDPTMAGAGIVAIDRDNRRAFADESAFNVIEEEGSRWQKRHAVIGGD